MALEPEWCAVPCGYALQAVVCNVAAHQADVTTRFSTPQEAYPPGERVFLLTQGQYYGCLATVRTVYTARLFYQGEKKRGFRNHGENTLMNKICMLHYRHSISLS